MLFLRFCPCNWGTRKREDAAPKASVCFLGGAQEIFDGVSEGLLGGAGKAEDAKLPGAGIIPELCPMKGRNGNNGANAMISLSRKNTAQEGRIAAQNRKALSVVCSDKTDSTLFDSLHPFISTMRLIDSHYVPVHFGRRKLMGFKCWHLSS
jgi:hypothetical protein